MPLLTSEIPPMSKNIFLFLLAAVFLLSAAGCEKKQTAAELNAEKEKKWRAQQSQKAVKYYEELVKEYPDSPQAEQARQKLQQLGPSKSTAAKK